MGGREEGKNGDKEVSIPTKKAGGVGGWGGGENTRGHFQLFAEDRFPESPTHCDKKGERPFADADSGAIAIYRDKKGRALRTERHGKVSSD